MLTSQRLSLRSSEVRQRLNELASVEGDLSEEDRSEIDSLTNELSDVETRYRAALVSEDEAAAEADGDPARLELRSNASLANFVVAAIQGRSVSGADLEYAQEVRCGTGMVPLELAGPIETRADAASPAPSSGLGVNLDPIRPAIFARSVATRLGIEMPTVPSGTFSTGTIATSLTADAEAKGDAAESTAAAITTQTTTPHRISARLTVRLEDVATIGTGNFEAILRQNLMLAQSAALDQFALNGDGSGANPQGLIGRLTDPTDPTAVVDWLGFVRAIADGIDGGPWAESMTDVRLLVNAETMRLAETTFRMPGSVGTPADTYSDTPGETSAAAYLRANSGAFFSSSRMPATASTIAPAVRFRPGTMGLDGVNAMQTAVCPTWGSMAVDDIYSDSASATHHFTIHALVGDVILVQPSAYERVDLKLA